MPLAPPPTLALPLSVDPDEPAVIATADGWLIECWDAGPDAAAVSGYIVAAVNSHAALVDAARAALAHFAAAYGPDDRCHLRDTLAAALAAAGESAGE